MAKAIASGDERLMQKAGLEAAASVPWTFDDRGEHSPQVWLVNFGDSAVVIACELHLARFLLGI